MPEAPPEVARADAARARLLQAAVEAFAEKGFHGTTTRDIAAAAGMSPAAIYVHHRSKEELLFLISKAGHEATLGLVRAALAGSGSSTEALGRVVGDFAEHHARGHTSARIVNYELKALAPEHLAEIRAIRHEIETAIRDLVSRGVANGEFTTTDPKISAAAILSLGIDLARWYYDGARWTPEEVGRQYAEMALRMVGARSGGTRSLDAWGS